MLHQSRLRSGSLERSLPRQHLVNHTGKAVGVAAGVHLLSHRLLRTHVSRSADGGAGHGDVVVLTHVTHRLSDPKIGDQRMSFGDQNVLRLDVAVHEVLPVCVCQGAGYLVDHTERILDRNLLLPIHQVAQRLTIDERHHVVEEAVCVARVVERQDVRVGQLGRDLDLPQEPLGPYRSRHRGPQDLDGHSAPVLAVLGEIHGRHPAPSHLPLDPVAVGQSRNQALRIQSHPIGGPCVSPWGHSLAVFRAVGPGDILGSSRTSLGDLPLA